nr:hypothetical protein CFP56_21013 [Quercus suber]
MAMELKLHQNPLVLVPIHYGPFVTFVPLPTGIDRRVCELSPGISRRLSAFLQLSAVILYSTVQCCGRAAYRPSRGSPGPRMVGVVVHRILPGTFLHRGEGGTGSPLVLTPSLLAFLPSSDMHYTSSSVSISRRQPPLSPVRARRAASSDTSPAVALFRKSARDACFMLLRDFYLWRRRG